MAYRYNSCFSTNPIKVDPTQAEILDRAAWVLETENDTGTAFFLKGLGLVTAVHCVNGASSIQVFHPAKTANTFKVGVQHICTHRDLALLSHSIPSMDYFELDEFSGLPATGANTIAAGFPSYGPGDRLNIRPGTISSLTVKHAVKLIEVTQKLSQGMSGGPLMTQDHEVIGVIHKGGPDESNGESPTDIRNLPTTRGAICYLANDRIVHKWQAYAGRFETVTVRAHLRSIRMLEVHLGAKAFDKVTPTDAAAFRDHLVKLGQTPKEDAGLSNSTIRHHASQVRQFFDWLRIQDGYKRLSQNILLNLELPKAVRARTLPREDRDYLTIEEAEEMLTKIPVRTIAELRDRAIIACAYTWGLRAAALTTLRLKHIDMQKKEMLQDATEMRAKNGKSFRSFFFPRTEAFQQVLGDWLTELADLGFTEDDAVFPSLNDLTDHAPGAAPVSPMQSSAAVGKAFKAATALIDRCCTPHSARDTLVYLGNELTSSRKEERAFSLNLGHARPQVKETYYAKMTDEQRRSTIEGLCAGTQFTAKEQSMVLDFYESRFERGSKEYKYAKRLADRRAAARDGEDVLE